MCRFFWSWNNSSLLQGPSKTTPACNKREHGFHSQKLGLTRNPDQTTAKDKILPLCKFWGKILVRELGSFLNQCVNDNGRPSYTLQASF
jgi:hypothetical protein